MKFDTVNDEQMNREVGLIPHKPLKPATKYTVHLQGTITDVELSPLPRGPVVFTDSISHWAGTEGYLGASLTPRQKLTGVRTGNAASPVSRADPAVLLVDMLKQRGRIK